MANPDEFRTTPVNETGRFDEQNENLKMIKQKVHTITRKILDLIMKCPETEAGEELKEELKILIAEREALVKDLEEVKSELYAFLSAQQNVQILWGSLKDHFLEEPVLLLQIINDNEEEINNLRASLEQQGLGVGNTTEKLPLPTFKITSKDKLGKQNAEFADLAFIYRAL